MRVLCFVSHDHHQSILLVDQSHDDLLLRIDNSSLKLFPARIKYIRLLIINRADCISTFCFWVRNQELLNPPHANYTFGLFDIVQCLGSGFANHIRANHLLILI
jgi:hypothetical protein